MTTALCLGGAADVQKDWAAALALGEFDCVVACNDVGAIWPGRLDAWVTLHPEKLAGWREQRRANGHPDAGRYLAHGDLLPDWMELVEFRFPGQDNSGSSGLFAAKAALIDLGADRAVLVGIPLARTPHFFDAQRWEAAGGYREVWQNLRPEYRARIRSMSGWTAHLFGTPTTEWLATGDTCADVLAPTLESTRMKKPQKIIYEPHPVSPERKRELNAQGYKIIDAAFAPKNFLREDGPTVAEFVAAGYLAVNYPPTGYASRSAEQEIADAIAAQDSDSTQAQQGAGNDGLQPPANDGLDSLGAEQLHALAKERGVNVHHASGADKVRAALRETAAQGKSGE